MATINHHLLHQQQQQQHHRRHVPSILLHRTTTPNFLIPINPACNLTPSISYNTNSFYPVFSTSSDVTAAAARSTSLDLLATHLAAQDFRQADEETRRLLIALAGDAAVKRGYVFFSELQFVASADLKAIDQLWLAHSNNKFGYSVQRSIWDKSNRDFSTFFVRVGWMKKLDTEVTQYGYRAFPNEFTWELTPETPVGHLPLTNALRGTQLLKCLLTHPAFADVESDVDDGDMQKALLGTTKPLSKRVFKSDYSF